MSEPKRGCGYRKIGAIYLTSDPGYVLICDGLPLELKECECCGFVPPFSRNLQRLHPGYIIQASKKKHGAKTVKEFLKKCSCPPMCPICYPEFQGEDGIFIGKKGDIYPLWLKSYGLMFVGKKFYTPRSFIHEAETMGVCKRIPDIPKWLILGKTWVFLAHNEVPKVSLEQMKSNEMHMKEPEKMKAIFYAFKPQRIEMPVFKNQISDEEILILEKKGITPVLLDPTPENKKRHGWVKSTKTLMRLLQPDDEEAER